MMLFEKRSTQDTWLFADGAVVTFVCFFFVMTVGRMMIGTDNSLTLYRKYTLQEIRT